MSPPPDYDDLIPDASWTVVRIKTVMADCDIPTVGCKRKEDYLNRLREHMAKKKVDEHFGP